MDFAANRVRSPHAVAGISLETTQDNGAAGALHRAAGWSEDATQWCSLPLFRSH